MSETKTEPAELKPTPAAEWPTNEPRLVELPSGAVASIIRPQFFMLRKTGQLPRRITAIVDKRERGETISEDQALLLLDYSVSLAFVDPPASLTKKKDHVHVGGMIEADKLTVLRYIHGGM